MIRFFAEHPTAGNLVMLFLAIIGLSAIPSLQRETFPDFSPQQLEIRIPYPGASAEDVEEAVCQRIEDAVDRVSEVIETICLSQEGVAVATVEMVEGGDIARFLDDIKTEIDAIDNFPDGAEKPVIQELGRTAQVVSIAITGPMSVGHLKSYAEQIRTKLQRQPHVSQVELIGFSDRQLRIEIPARNLRRYHLSISDIAATISRQGIDLPAGLLKTHDRDLLLRFTDLRRTTEELAGLVVVGAATGGQIRLGDIAKISDRFELEEEKILFNGKRAALLQVVKTKQQDTLIVMAAVSKFVETMRLQAPPGVILTLTQDRSTNVRDRLRLLLENGIQGLVLVFLAMWLFFHGRFAFWVTMGLPVSFLGALFFMSVLGLTINMITMVGLLVSIGLLMDDAIVISENIATRLGKGASALEAAIGGTRQVAPGVISSFLTTIAIFGPLAFLSGKMGKVLQFIPMVLILVLAVSLLEAFLILPHHLAHAMKNPPKKQSRFRAWFEARLEIFREKILGRAIDGVIRRRYGFIGGVIALFIVSIGLLVGGVIKFQPFPSIEGDSLEARLLLPQGTPLIQTEQVVTQITAALKRVDEEFTPLQKGEKPLVQNVQVRFNTNRDAGESGPHLATIMVDLITAEERRGSLNEIIQHWRKEVGDISGLLALNFKEPTVGPAGIPLELRLTGDNLHQLKNASLDLQEWLRRYKGVINLSDDLRPGKPELLIHLRDGAMSLGVDAASAANQLRSAFSSVVAQEVVSGGESFEIDVRLASEAGLSMRDLEEFRITTAQGDLVPLSMIAIIETARGFSRIRNVDGVRTVTVSSDLDTRVANSQEIIGHTKKNFLSDLLKRYPGVKVGVEGESRESAKTGSSMLRGFGIGLAFIFILLSFQFRSYIEPLAVMAVIPMAMIGVLWGHLLMGLNLTMPGMIGFASLAGIVVNDSILLVEFLKLRMAEGHQVKEAAMMASRERFRAILLTSVTTIAGLIPLLLEKSLQAQILVPLATSIVFGLLATTIAVLLVVPALYSIFADFKDDHQPSSIN
jgi:hydrophobic/amphiphilic exporter-1 (mainly G- bacteria), HAE1 family